MLQARDLGEHQILWQTKGEFSFVVLKFNIYRIFIHFNIGKQRIGWRYHCERDLVQGMSWKEQRITELFLVEVAKHILDKIRPPVHKGKEEKLI